MGHRQDTAGEAETERLLLLPQSDDYLGEFARVCQEPEAMRFSGLAFQAELAFRGAEVAWYALDRPGHS